jgi:hypothetical protein
VRRWIPLVLAAAALAQEAGEPAPNRLDETNAEGAKRVTRTFARQGADLVTRLKGLTKEDVIVVGGLFDFVQELLVAFRVPHTVVTPAELEHVAMKRPERMLFFLNCHLLDRRFPSRQRKTARPGAKEAKARLARELEEAGLGGDSAPGKAIRERFEEVALFAGSDYSEAGLKRLGEAIRKGAWAVSNDWALLAMERALPGTIRWTGHTTAEETIEVRPSPVGRRHPLLEGVFPESGKAKLWLEAESYLFAVRGRYTTLIESLALGSRYGGNRKVVVLLEPGKGKVLHALPHTYLQQGRAEDAAVMQRLILNFALAKSLQNWKRQEDEEK